MSEILPGDRVKAFDHRLFKNDRDTPLSITMQTGTVVCRYGKKTSQGWIYEDLVDVVFDYDGRTSKGHFTRLVEKI